MIYLLISIVFMASMPVMLRAATNRGASPWMLNSVFRILGGGVTLVSFILFRESFQGAFRAELLVAMILGGLCYWLTAYAATLAIQQGHLGITWTVTRCAMLIPTLASLFLWDEIAGMTNEGVLAVGVGLFFIVAAMALFGVDQIFRRSESALRKPTWTWVGWLALAFLFAGGWETSLGYAGSLPDDQSRFLFLHGAFLVSALFSCGLMAGARRLPTRVEWQYGLAIAVAALVGSGLRPWAVHELGGRLVFPLTAIGVMVLVQCVSSIIWSEHVGRWGYWGFGVAALGIVILGFH